MSIAAAQVRSMDLPASDPESDQGLKILVADDSPNIRFGLTTLLKKWGYQVEAAANGRDAWESLNREPMQFLITDWMMPEMDGLELVTRVREADWNRYVYVIVLTSMEDSDALVQGMQAGADDYLIKPFKSDELGVRIKAGLRVLSLEKQLENKNKALSKTNEKLSSALKTIETDLDAAATVQQNLIPAPADALGGLSFRWLFEPSTFIGGDTLNYLMIDDDHVLFYNLDVAGHGVSSALVSVMLSKMLTSDACREMMSVADPHSTGISPHLLVSELNDRFQVGFDDGKYFTIALGIYNRAAGVMQLCQAGHPHPLILDRHGQARFVGDGGMPVGLFPAVDYESFTVDFAAGDRMFIHSDGITECEDDRGEQFGEERFRKLLEELAGRDLHDIINEIELQVRRWSSSDEFGDDLSLLGLECLA